MLTVLGWFFAIATIVGFLGLAYVAAPRVPRIAGSTAFIVTLAALGLAIRR